MVGLLPGFFQGARQLRPNRSRQAVYGRLERLAALGERIESVLLPAGKLPKRFQLGARAADRFDKTPRAIVAGFGKRGEALVELAERALDVGDHPLRRALLLG